MQFRSAIVSTLIACVALVTASVYAQPGIAPISIERVGQSGWQFLKINGDARQAGMGGAYTAIGKGDASAVFGNPAELSSVKHLDVQLNVLQWVADIGHQSAAIACNFNDIGVVAVSVAVLGYGNIPETINESLGASGTNPVVTGNMFTAKDIVAGFSYARKITDNLSIGGNIRWMQQQIAELSMRNWSLDFGTMYYTGYKSLRLAFAVRNFGPDSRFAGWSEEYQTESDKVRMPIDFRAGMAMDFLDGEDSPHVLTVVVEGEHPNDGTEKINMGTSYTFDGALVLRAGYRFNYDVQGITFGGGIIYPLGGMNANVNYAYVDFGELTQVHMLSFGLSF